MIAVIRPLTTLSDQIADKLSQIGRSSQYQCFIIPRQKSFSRKDIKAVVRSNATNQISGNEISKFMDSFSPKWINGKYEKYKAAGMAQIKNLNSFFTLFFLLTFFDKVF